MTVDTEKVLEAPIKAKLGRPKKVGDSIAGDRVELPAGFKKVTRRADLGSQGVLDIPKWILDTLWGSGVSVEWKAVSVRGDEQIVRTELQNYRQQGWRSVTADMFVFRGKPIFDGMYYEAGYKGEILVGGQLLHYRPRELTEQAWAEMAREAQRPIDATMHRMKQGIIEGTDSSVTTGTPLAKSWRNQTQVTIEQPIPMPD